MTTEGKKLTRKYSYVQCSFWMSFCLALGFAAVYLQALGYSNAELGIVVAAGNLIGVFLGPQLSSMIDSREKITPGVLLPPAFAVQAAVLILMMISQSKGIITSIAYAVFIGICGSVNSLILKIYADVAYAGLELDFGFARGIGSLGYVLNSFLLGAIVSRTTAMVIPVFGIVITAFQLISFLAIKKDLPYVRNTEGTQKSGLSMMAFFARNKRFAALLFGTMLLFYSNNTLCNFFINVTRNVGGGEGAMGFLNGFMAAVEVPVMLIYSKAFARFKSSSVLRVAFVFFTLKASALALASTVPQVTAALLLQGPSFALYAAAIVFYVDETIAYEDSAKAQSLAFTMTVIGSVLASLISGRLYDILPVTEVLWIAAAVCAAGTIIAVLAVKTVDDER